MKKYCSFFFKSLKELRVRDDVISLLPLNAVIFKHAREMMCSNEFWVGSLKPGFVVRIWQCFIMIRRNESGRRLSYTRRSYLRGKTPRKKILK
jgi:hypothetical protein